MRRLSKQLFCTFVPTFKYFKYILIRTNKCFKNVVQSSPLLFRSIRCLDIWYALTVPVVQNVDECLVD